MWGWLVVEEPHDIRDLVLFVTMNAKNLGRRSLAARGPVRNAAQKMLAKLDGFNPKGKAAACHPVRKGRVASDGR